MKSKRYPNRDALVLLFKALTANMPEKGWRIAFEPWAETRSERQNRLLWASAYPAIANHISEQMGRAITTEHVHEVAKDKFLPKVHNPLTDKMYPKSTTKLTKPEFNDYLEQVYAWGAGMGAFFD